MKKPRKTALIISLIRKADDAANEVPVIAAMECKRKEYGLTQSEFSRVLKMQPPHYSEFLRGNRRLPVKAMHRAAAIGVAPCVLLEVGKEANAT